MKCEKCRKWVSDDLGGGLSIKRRSALRLHLEGCPSCRRYAGDLKILDARARAGGDAHPPAGYWEDLSRRLDVRIAAAAAVKSRPWRLPAAPRKWAWAGAALVPAAFLGAYLFLFRSAPPVEHIFSTEDALARIYLEIGDDADLESRFGQSLAASVAEAVQGVNGEGGARFPEETDFWESLTDEDLKFIQSELEKGTT